MGIWNCTGSGYFKNIDAEAKEQEMLLNVDVTQDGVRLVLSQNREFGFGQMKDLDDRSGTRGEAVITMNARQARELAERMVRILDLLNKH